jgi:hypothetical protein
MNDQTIIDTDQTPLVVQTAPETPAVATAEAASASPPGGADDAVVLTLNDLLPDPQGDIVLLNHSGTLEMAVLTDKAVVDTGVADHHTTADGTDVMGMTYYSFESGPTLYVPSDLHLSVMAGPIV